jgi:hypothetical protein
LLEFVVGLCSIKDAVQRGRATAGRLLELDDESLIEALAAIIELAYAREEAGILLYNGLVSSSALVDLLGKQRLASLVECAQETEQYQVVGLLLDFAGPEKDGFAHQPFLDGALKEMPLGMRKSLAKKPDFRLIKRIAKDQDHRVIRVLLDNPRLTERDVVTIGATRPTSVKVLGEIHNHKKWFARHSVKKVIVMNPYAPLSMSLRLLAFMKLEDLVEICERSDLDGVLTSEAKKIISKKLQACGAGSGLVLDDTADPVYLPDNCE